MLKINSLKNIRWTLRHPVKALQIQINKFTSWLSPKNGTLVYVGLNNGASFDTIFRRYNRIYGFEANPERYAEVQKRYQKSSRITLVHAAVSETNGTITFNISDDTNAGSSSIGKFNPEWNALRETPIQNRQSITVPSINLMHFCKTHKINKITDYISDIQGMDLTVLKTLSPLIKNKQIESITCEVTKDGRQIYNDIPSNNLSDFQQLLGENYEMVAIGASPLKDGQFDDVPEDYWEMDCKWRVKK